MCFASKNSFLSLKYRKSKVSLFNVGGGVLLDIFGTAVLLGFITVMPVGPIAVLIIERTAWQGILAGLATGLGAAVADGLYGVAIVTGFMAVTSLSAYEDIMAIGGGLLLLWLGIHNLYRFWQHTYAEQGQKTEQNRHHWGYHFGTSFILTLMNPMTIILFVGLISLLSKMAENKAISPFILVAGLFVGSVLWQIFLVAAAKIAVTIFSSKLYALLDFISGTLLVIFAIYHLSIYV